MSLITKFSTIESKSFFLFSFKEYNLIYNGWHTFLDHPSEKVFRILLYCVTTFDECHLAKQNSLRVSSVEASNLVKESHDFFFEYKGISRFLKLL
jgi:hypothetical protein